MSDFETNPMGTAKRLDLLEKILSAENMTYEQLQEMLDDAQAASSTDVVTLSAMIARSGCTI